jgi:hypothetical protein
MTADSVWRAHVASLSSLPRDGGDGHKPGGGDPVGRGQVTDRSIRNDGL